LTALPREGKRLGDMVLAACTAQSFTPCFFVLIAGSSVSQPRPASKPFPSALRGVDSLGLACAQVLVQLLLLFAVTKALFVDLSTHLSAVSHLMHDLSLIGN